MGRYGIYWHYTHTMRSRVYDICRASVRPSVSLSVPARGHSRKPAAAGLLLLARPAGDIDGLLQGAQQHRVRPMNAGSATLSAYVRS